MRKMVKDLELEGPWLFYSGFDDRRKDSEIISEKLAKRLGLKNREGEGAEYMDGEDAVHNIDDVRIKDYEDTPPENYYWGVYSRAYAQAVTGKIYVAIPKGKGIN